MLLTIVVVVAIRSALLLAGASYIGAVPKNVSGSKVKWLMNNCPSGPFLAAETVYPESHQPRNHGIVEAGRFASTPRKRYIDS